MRCFAGFGAALLALCLGGAVLAQDADLSTVSGTVKKVEKDTLGVQTRGADGKFGKELTVKLTGTTKITLLTREKRGGKLVPVQRDFDAKDLEAGQQIVLIHTGGTEPVLLSAVIQKK
ncbi:MAG: hypothetical protein K2X38_09830 [Gemmataceae bacterium]|nr:hypothetical protein [Gemmataceae bacterium]